MIREPDPDETPLSFDEKMILLDILAHGALND